MGLEWGETQLIENAAGKVDVVKISRVDSDESANNQNAIVFLSPADAKPRSEWTESEVAAFAEKHRQANGMD